MRVYPDFSSAITSASNALRDTSHLIHPQRWQGVDVSAKPEMATYEVLNYSFGVAMRHDDLNLLREEIRPNLPWADDHFEERVAGQPLNPGVQWANWPYAKSADKFRDQDGGAFTHTYMERFWPRFAGKTAGGKIKPWPSGNSDLRPNRGYRYELGDLGDVCQQIAFEPDTRQCFLPVWFPEDTGGVHKGRLPCTLGYHFIQRLGRLHIVYYLRSCDFMRHFRDDVYLAVRLKLWLLERCRQLNPEVWNAVLPGTYTMHITSFHLFKNDYPTLYGRDLRTR